MSTLPSDNPANMLAATRIITMIRSAGPLPAIFIGFQGKIASV
jgi:hypothetical protein